MHATWRRAACLAAAVALGCAQTREVGRELNPVGAREATVLSATLRGPYLVAQLGGRVGLSLFAPADATCARVLAPEASVHYRKSGVFGRVARDDEVCDAVGVASLAAWRDRQPRANAPPAPSATVRFSVMHRDPRFVLVRGRFPLVGLVGIPAGYDLVAMLPNDDACAPAIARGVATMVFLTAGPEAFRLMGERGACPVLGFAMPLAGPAPAP